MKILSIAVPCYNSSEYLDKCISSLLTGGSEIEIIIVDDGSTDSTAQIADDYQEKYPDIVKVIHQENAGHGGAVNAGLNNATGLYFKVVDSDDWVNEEAYHKILSALETLVKENNQVDMLISNFVYEKAQAKHKKVMHYRNSLPQDKVFGWNDVKHMGMSRYFLMHSVIFRTRLLIECNLELPKHTFYVDNIFVFQPLPYVKKMYYMDVNFYRYYIGRSDQSVNESVMISRLDQQIKVNKLMVDYFDIRKVQNRKLRNYMLSYLDIITVVTCILLIRSKRDDEKELRKELLGYIKKKNYYIYHKLKRRITGAANLPGKSGRTLAVTTYKIYQKIYGFN